MLNVPGPCVEESTPSCQDSGKVSLQHLLSFQQQTLWHHKTPPVSSLTRVFLSSFSLKLKPVLIGIFPPLSIFIYNLFIFSHPSPLLMSLSLLMNLHCIDISCQYCESILPKLRTSGRSTSHSVAWEHIPSSRSRLSQSSSMFTARPSLQMTAAISLVSHLESLSFKIANKYLNIQPSKYFNYASNEAELYFNQHILALIVPLQTDKTAAKLKI